MTTFAVLLLMLFSKDGYEPGRVAAVLDGDTVVRYVRGERQVCRLYGADAPEMRLRRVRDKAGNVVGYEPRPKGLQPGGPEARAFVLDFTAGQQLAFKYVGQDLYGRPVVRVRLHRRDLSEELVKAGHAWHYKQYAPHDDRLKAFELEARAAGRGIWGASEPPMEPAKWRSLH